MEAAKPYASELMTNGGPDEPNGLLGELSRQAAQVGSSALSLPRRIEDTLDRLDRGDIRVRIRSIESDRIMRRNSNLSLANSYALLVGTFTLSATLLTIFLRSAHDLACSCDGWPSCLHRHCPNPSTDARGKGR